MRVLLACTCLCLAAFSSVADPEEGVGAISSEAAGAAVTKSDMAPKDQSRFAQQKDESSPAQDQQDEGIGIRLADWPILLGADLTRVVFVGEDNAADAASDPQAAEAEDVSHEPSSDEVCAALASAAQENHLPVAFLLRLIWQESRFDSHAVSRAGAQGVAQFMPQSAAEAGLDNPFDPIQALPASARLLSSLQARFGNLGLAAAAYNAGPKRIHDWLTRGTRLPGETRDYVLKVTGRAPELWRRAAWRSLDLRIPARAPCREVAEPAIDEAAAVPLPVPAPYLKLSLPAPSVKTAQHGRRHLVRLASIANEGEGRRHRHH